MFNESSRENVRRPSKNECSRHVWDKMATCWAGKKDRRCAKKKQNSPGDKYKFIAYILNEMKLSTEHRQTKKRGLRKDTQRFCHPKTSLCTRVVKDLRHNCVETAMWHAIGSMVNLFKEHNTKRQLGKFKGSYTHREREESPRRFRTSTVL